MTHKSTTSSNSSTLKKPSFSIISAKTLKDGHKKFVLYTIAVDRKIGVDASQASLDRRYSQFHNLNKQLNRKFPEFMASVFFPRKVLTGNYKHQFIAERSRAFEQYLTHIYANEEIRTSTEFQDFFYNEDIRSSYRMMSQGNYTEAIPLLQNALHLQEKLLGEDHQDTLTTFCALVVSYMSIEDGDAHALGYAESAFQIIQEAQNSPFKIPLIQSLIGVRWRLNKDKRDLEGLLARCMQPVGDGPVRMPTLEELVMQNLSHI